MFNLEVKLRTIAKLPTDCRLVSIFDSCRVSLESQKYKDLIGGRNTAAEERDDTSESGDEEPVKYFHLTACHPGGIAHADGGFAAKVLDRCKKWTAKAPNAGFMEWPRDFQKAKWGDGEIKSSGGSDYLVPFNLNDITNQTEEEYKEPTK